MVGGACIVSLLVVLITAAHYVQGDITNDYNPLNPQVYDGYSRHGDWVMVATAGQLSASSADFVKKVPWANPKTLCVRALVFMAHGAVLDHVVTGCDSPEPSMALLTEETTLRYYDIAMLKEEGTGRYIFVKRGSEDKCKKMVYKLDDYTGSSPSPKVGNKEASPDTSCSDLIAFKIPPMWLLSSNGDVGNFGPVNTEWVIINPWEPLGFVTREYTYKSPADRGAVKCFRLVVVTSHGRVVDGVKLTCGTLRDVTVTDSSLHLGDTVLVTLETQDKFTVFLNPRNGSCLKKTISVAVKDDSTQRKELKIEKLTLQDKSCNDLVNGEVQDYVVKRDQIKHLTTTAIEEVFKQEKLKQYTASGERIDFNIARDLGMMVETYTKNDDKTKVDIVTLVARGVPILPTIVDAGVPRRIVLRQDGVFYDNNVAFTKLYSIQGFQLLKRRDEEHCARRLYDVNADGLLEEAIEGLNNKETHKGNKDEGLYKGVPNTRPGTRIQTSTTAPEVRRIEDGNCKDLIGGKHFRMKELSTFPSLTDELGVPKKFPSFTEEGN